MTTSPLVSIVVPTHNRKQSLQQTLASLAKQTFPPDCFEVIVVDDGSTDGTETVRKQTFPFFLRYIRQDHQGDALARNRGAEESRADLLVFLDDDITVAPEYVDSLAKEHRDSKPQIVNGLLYPAPVNNPNPFRKIYSEIDSNSLTEQMHFVENLSGVLCIKRQDYMDIGMMEHLPVPGSSLWAGVEFAYRAYLRGFSFKRCLSAVAYHNDYALSDLSTCCRRSYRAASAAVLLFHKHPELLPLLPMFRDKTPIVWGREAAALIARKVARRSASSLPVLWAMERLVHLLEQYCPSPALLRPLYRWIIGGYIFRGFRDGLRKYGPIPSCKDEQVTLLLPRHSVSEEK
ncbi:MAG: glycosyltransferase [Candidatus Methanomethyliaceae archaeon]